MIIIFITNILTINRFILLVLFPFKLGHNILYGNGVDIFDNGIGNQFTKPVIVSDGNGDDDDDEKEGEAIPGYNLMIVIAMIGVIFIIIAKKYRKYRHY